MHYADIDLGLASLGTNRPEKFFVRDFPAVRLNAHALDMIYSAHVVVYVYILTMCSL